MRQSWQSLLFAHWRVDPERIQRTLPAGLHVDTFDGSAYVGVVPFFMRNIRPWWSPCIPGLSNFLELNVRTYVHDAAGRSGVWFYSLDCNQPIAVWGARKFYHLPYYHADMSDRRAGRVEQAEPETIIYASKRSRTWLGCDVRYTLGREPREAVPGSLDFFLIERYLLFAASPGPRIFTGQVYHRPYPIVDAAISDWHCDLFTEHDFGLDASQPELLHGSPGVDVEVFSLEACDRQLF